MAAMSTAHSHFHLPIQGKEKTAEGDNGSFLHQVWHLNNRWVTFGREVWTETVGALSNAHTAYAVEVGSLQGLLCNPVLFQLLHQLYPCSHISAQIHLGAVLA